MMVTIMVERMTLPTDIHFLGVIIKNHLHEAHSAADNSAASWCQDLSLLLRQPAYE